mmetsp:Transcript_7032/g.9159  ORF Transcript_7032/g.9159 Transcript_7032/m.9159 type:complete len:391 (-) Transcript_7032:717-1889(-)
MHVRQSLHNTGRVKNGLFICELIGCWCVHDTFQFSSLHQTHEHVHESMILEGCHQVGDKWMMQGSHDLSLVHDTSGLVILDQFILGLNFQSIHQCLALRILARDEPYLSKSTGTENCMFGKIGHGNCGKGPNGIFLIGKTFAHIRCIKDFSTIFQEQDGHHDLFGRDLDCVRGLDFGGVTRSILSSLSIQQHEVITKHAHFVHGDITSRVFQMDGSLVQSVQTSLSFFAKTNNFVAFIEFNRFDIFDHGIQNFITEMGVVNAFDRCQSFSSQRTCRHRFNRTAHGIDKAFLINAKCSSLRLCDHIAKDWRPRNEGMLSKMITLFNFNIRQSFTSHFQISHQNFSLIHYPKAGGLLALLAHIIPFTEHMKRHDIHQPLLVSVRKMRHQEIN